MATRAGERLNRAGWMLHRSGLATALALASALCAITAAHADPRHEERRDERRPGYDHLDARFSHNHYYPSRGYEVRDLPRDRVIINGPRGRFFFSGGVWYAPRGDRFVVVSAPIGVFVPVLPPYYTTVWIGGIPYYYADDTYYAWRESDRQYEVVPPPDDRQPETTQPPPNDDIFVYPKNGQPAAAGPRQVRVSQMGSEPEWIRPHPARRRRTSRAGG